MNAGCYDAHSDLSNGDPIELLNDLNTIIQSTWKELSQATHVIMTYGRPGSIEIMKAAIVTCHKVPQNSLRTVGDRCYRRKHYKNNLFYTIRKSQSGP
jgi:hypothetical protein